MTPRATEIERRYTPGTVELRTDRAKVDAPGGGQTSVQVRAFHGYALKFAKLSQNLGGFVEQVAGRSTIAKTLADGGDVVARMHHDDRYLLGRVSSGTLALEPDDVGLRYDVTSPDTTYARDLEALARRGDIRHSSFAFRTIDDDWGLTDSGFPVRTLVEVQLVDVAPVVQPAYLDTSSSVRSLAGRLDASPDEVAELLRSGRLKDALQRPATTVVDLGAESFIPKPSSRKFNPRQPRGNDGKWSDGPGGGLADLLGDDEDDGPEFTAKLTAKAGTGKVGIALREDGGVDLGLRYTDDPAVTVVSLDPDDVEDLDAHLSWTVDELEKQQDRFDDWNDESLNNPEHQKMWGDRDAKFQSSKRFPNGHPERARIQREAADMPKPPDNPHEKELGESVATFGDLHFSANLTDTGPEIKMSDSRISEDTYDDTALIMSPKQARDLITKIKATASGERAATQTTENATPDDLHVTLSVRARQLELMRRSFP